MENYIGYFAAVCTTMAFLPQAVRVYKTKQTKDISLGTFILMAVGVAAWLVYGIIVKSMPILLANFITLILVLYIFMMKLRFEYPGKEKATD